MKFGSGLLLLLTTTALCHADMIMTYSTSGVFSTTGTSTLTFSDGDSITYDGINSQSISVPSSGAGNLSYGQFDTNGLTATTSSVPSGETFTLTLTQSSPSTNGFSDVATLAGTISSTGSTIFVSFPTLDFAVGSDLFHISQPGGGFVVVAPSNNNGITTVNGTVSLAAAPEPSTMLLFGAGLISLAILGRKRSVRSN